MRTPSCVSIARRLGSSRPSNRRENRLALAAGFMQEFLDRKADKAGQTEGWISKNRPDEATETVCMTKGGKRVAWVTGGGSGIGEAGAEALAADGWIVVVSGRRQSALDTVVAKIAKAGGAAEAIALDVADAGEARKAADQIVAKHGRIDLLVNNAGINV